MSSKHFFLVSVGNSKPVVCSTIYSLNSLLEQTEVGIPVQIIIAEDYVDYNCEVAVDDE